MGKKNRSKKTTVLTIIFEGKFERVTNGPIDMSLETMPICEYPKIGP